MNHLDNLLSEAQRLHRSGRIEEARKTYERILSQDAKHGPARLFRALILQQSGKTQDALSEARQAMEYMKDPEALIYANYGVILKNAGLLAEAEAIYQKALSKDPNNLGIKANLGTLQLMTGQLDSAKTLFEELSRLMEEPAPWLNLARIALVRNDYEPIEEYLRKAEDLAPKHPDLPLLRARYAAALKDDVSTYKHIKTLLAIQPAHADAWFMLTQLAPKTLELDHLAQAVEALVNTQVQQASLLTYVVSLCRHNLLWSVLPKLEKLLITALEHPIDKALSSTATFSLLGANVPQRAHRKSAEVTWKALIAGVTPLPPRTVLPRQPGKKIKVAFMSSDFRAHAGGTLLVGLLENLRHEHIEWYAYSNSFDDNSIHRSRIRACFDRFINIATLDHQELAQKLRDDGIDILIDRNGMTRDTRILVTAWRPVPIQMTYLAMPGSVGAGGDVDYLIGDPWVTTEANRDGFSEHILRLPRCYQPNDHQRPNLDKSGTRESHGLPETGIVFCCFNQYFKFSPDTFKLWCRILDEIKDSVLWLLEPSTPAITEQLRNHLKQGGIDPERLILAPVKGHSEHIARISHADLILDTWPYNAHTTASDALRVGVPVVTLPGQTFASRVAASILETCQLKAWIASTPEEYVEKALAYARSPRDTIDAIKKQVYETYWTSPMVDNKTLAAQFEALCLGIYDRHAAGKPVVDLQLTSDLRLEKLDWKYQDQDVSDHVNRIEIIEPNQRSNHPADPEMMSWLPHGKVRVVDIGVDTREGGRPYWELLKQDLVSVTGFTVHSDILQELNKNKIGSEEYFFSMIGSGKAQKLFYYELPGITSALQPNKEFLRCFPQYSKSITVKETDVLSTTRLDDINNSQKIDWLKINIQGGELAILESGGKKIDTVLVVHVSVKFVDVYLYQPLFRDIDQWMNDKGFFLHGFINRATDICGSTEFSEKRLKQRMSQVIGGDAVYVRDIKYLDKLHDEEKKKMALILGMGYGSHDMALTILKHCPEFEKNKYISHFAQFC